MGLDTDDEGASSAFETGSRSHSAQGKKRRGDLSSVEKEQELNIDEDDKGSMEFINQMQTK